VLAIVFLVFLEAAKSMQRVVALWEPLIGIACSMKVCAYRAGKEGEC